MSQESVLYAFWKESREKEYFGMESSWTMMFACDRTGNESSSGVGIIHIDCDLNVQLNFLLKSRMSQSVFQKPRS